MAFSLIPDEILQHIIQHVDPEGVLLVLSRVSRRFKRLSHEPLLWRQFCDTHFTFWEQSHDIVKKRKSPLLEVDWRALFVLRLKRNRKASALFEEIIRTSVNRYKNTASIAQLGYDAKEFLLAQSQTPDGVHDVLARRYYAISVLDSIHRHMAIREWYNISRGLQGWRTDLERCLSCFDMFVLRDQEGDFDDITSYLDSLMVEFRASHPDLYFQSTRQRALALLRWLRSRGLVGMRSQREYRNLRHCLLGQSLRRDDHSSLPIISSAIFCCLAARMGVSAKCSAFPNHVHAVVLAPDGQTVDDVPIEDVRDTPQRRMFVDPFSSDDEIEERQLKIILASLGWQADAEVALAPVSPALVAIRVANNIRATKRLSSMADHNGAARLDSDAQALGQLLSGQSEWNILVCNYATLWASLILADQNDFEWGVWYHDMFNEMYKSFPEDVWLVEQYLRPSGASNIRQRLVRNEVRFASQGSGLVRSIQALDRQRPRSPRYPSMAKQPHKIGQVFRHKRYGWEGVITGWASPDAGGADMPRGGADGHTPANDDTYQSLSRLNSYGKIFYTCLRSNSPSRFIIDDTYVEIVNHMSPGRVMDFPFAGKYFKRFDEGSGTFVSNIRESFPDD